MIRRSTFIFAVFLALATTAQAAETSIVGDWYEEATYGGATTIALSHFRPDGTFSVTFHKCLKPQAIEHVDTGTWTYEGGKLRMITEASNGIWTMDIEDYQTISNNGKVWVYKSIAGDAFQEFGQITFHDLKVTPTSTMSGCDLTS